MALTDIIVAALGSSAGAAAVTGIFMLVKHRLERKDKKEDAADEQRLQECAARGEEINALRLSVDASNAACRVLLYDRIKHLAKIYISRAHITAEELEDLIAMHACYHDALRGNGFLDDLMAQVRRLPIK